ncbi:MAG: serine hydrolase [Ruminococcaceae bacterium]|nr:serine hydrolase [Oscillospiraceae bacterium]
MLRNTNLEHVKPEDVNVDSKAINDFLKEITAKKLGLHSFTIVRHDKICAQGFFAPYSAQYPHVLYSMSKSLTSTAVGFAVDEGLIKLDDKVMDFFPEYNNLRRAFNRTLTVRMLLTMRSDKLVTVFEEKGQTDWIKLFFDAPFMLPPNSKFNYISENTFMLSAIVTKVTGKSVLDYLDEKMFKPLGIEKPFWEADGKGNSAGGWGCYMRSEDLAKFFLPFIHGGKWIDGTQLIPEYWVREALSRQTDSVRDGALDIVNGYGFQFWKNRIANSFRADGLFGQRCFMFPDFDGLVILNCGEAEDYKVMEVFWKYFPNCFKSEELEENKKECDELEKIISSLSMPQLAVKPRNKLKEKEIEGRTISCKTNEYTSVVTVTTTQMLFNKPGNLNSMKFSFKDNTLLFTWKEKDYENTVEAGMDGELRMSEIRLADLHYHAFSQAAWQDDGSLKLWIRPVESAHERRFTFRFDETGVSVENESVPTFPDLTVYYLNFSGNPIKTAAGQRGLRRTVENLGLPLVEPNFKGTFVD